MSLVEKRERDKRLTLVPFNQHFLPNLELLFLIGDYLDSIPGGHLNKHAFLAFIHQAGLLPYTRSYLGNLRQRTPHELALISSSLQNYGLRDILLDWAHKHSFNTLLTIPHEPQRRPPDSIVDKLRLRQAQTGSHFTLASTMSKFEEIGIVSGHTHEAYCIMYDRSHTRLVTGSNDWNIKIWCARTGWLLHSLRGHLGPVDYMTINRESTMLASGCHDGAIRVWNLKHGKPIATLRTPQIARHPDYPNAGPNVPNARINRITSILWSGTPFPENRILVAASRDDGCLRIWRWVRGPSPDDPAVFLHVDQPLVIPFNTRTNDHPLLTEIDPSGLLLAVGGSDGTIRIFSTGPLVRHRFENSSSILFGPKDSLGPAPDSALTTADDVEVDGSDPEHRFAPLNASDIICVAHLSHNGPLVEAHFSEKSDRILAYAEDGQAIIWEIDPTTGTWSQFPLSKDPIDNSVILNQNSAGQSLSQTLIIPAASQGQQSSETDPARRAKKGRRKRKYDVLVVGWLEGDEYVVTANADGYIRVFDSRTKQLTHAKRGDGHPEGSSENPCPIDTLEPHPVVPDLYLTASSTNGYVALWHRSTVEPLWAVKHHGYVCHCDISQDGWTIAVSLYTNEFDSSGSQVTKVYAIAQDKFTAPIEQYSGPISNNMDHTTVEPTLFGSPFPYYEFAPQYVRPRDQDVYDNQPSFAYRTSLPAGLPEHQMREEDRTLVAQGRALVTGAFRNLVPNLLSQNELLAHAKQFGRRTRPRQTYSNTSQQVHLMDIDPSIPLILDFDDPDDEDYQEPTNGRERADDELADEEAEDGDMENDIDDDLGAIFHNNESDVDSERSRAEAAAVRHRAWDLYPAQECASNVTGVDDDPEFIRQLQAIADRDSGDDYEAPRPYHSSSSRTADPRTVSQQGSASMGRKRLTRSTSNQSQPSATETTAASSPQPRNSRRLRSTDFVLHSSPSLDVESNGAHSSMISTRANGRRSLNRRSRNDTGISHPSVELERVSGSLNGRRNQRVSVEPGKSRSPRQSKRRHVVIEDDDDESEGHLQPFSAASTDQVHGLRSSGRRITQQNAVDSTCEQVVYPEWMTAQLPDETFYYPQIGDRVAIFPEGYDQFVEHHLDNERETSPSASYARKRPRKMRKNASRDYFCAIVRNVDVVRRKPSNEWQTRLHIYRLDTLENEEIWYEGGGYVEFVVLLTRLQHVLEHTNLIKVDDKISVRYDEGVLYEAVVVRVDKDRIWNRLTVQYNPDDELTPICPWELDLVPIPPSHDEELPRNAVSTVKRLLKQFHNSEAMNTLSFQSSSTARPISVDLIGGRLENNFYRHPRELAMDLERLDCRLSERMDFARQKHDEICEAILQLRGKYPLELKIDTKLTSALDLLFPRSVPARPLSSVSNDRNGLAERTSDRTKRASFELEVPAKRATTLMAEILSDPVGPNRSARNGNFSPSLPFESGSDSDHSMGYGRRSTRTAARLAKDRILDSYHHQVPQSLPASSSSLPLSSSTQTRSLRASMREERQLSLTSTLSASVWQYSDPPHHPRSKRSKSMADAHANPSQDFQENTSISSHYGTRSQMKHSLGFSETVSTEFDSGPSSSPLIVRPRSRRLASRNGTESASSSSLPADDPSRDYQENLTRSHHATRSQVKRQHQLGLELESTFSDSVTTEFESDLSASPVLIIPRSARQPRNRVEAEPPYHLQTGPRRAYMKAMQTMSSSTRSSSSRPGLRQPDRTSKRRVSGTYTEQLSESECSESDDFDPAHYRTNKRARHQ